MLAISRCILFLLSLNIFLICGCGGVTTTNNTNAPGNTNSSVLVFSDIHFNPFYDPTLVQALVDADVSEWARIFQSSKTTAPSAWGTDTNYPLLKLALSGIRQNLGASPLVVYTGDILGHGIPQSYYTYLNGTKNPRDLADVAAMKVFTGKTVAFVMGQVRASVGNIPVMFAVGNSDSYSGYGPNGPDSSLSQDSRFLPDTAELYYSYFLNGAADHQKFLSTFTTGGYYSAEPPGTRLMVIGLNTVIYSPGIPGNNDSTVHSQLAWLDARLASATTAGKKVWLLMHVPPGADTATTARSIDNNGQIANATMMWKPADQASFLKTLAKYPGVIALTLAGHTHMDEYRILSPADVTCVIPAISPVFGNNPAFKVFTYSRDTLQPVDFRSQNYELASHPSQFDNFYTFSAAYSTHGLLNDSLAHLFPELTANTTKQALYRGRYRSQEADSTPATNTASPITTANWPVFFCGIGKMEQQAFLDCVNSY
jgi:sphingomyelin phosphodiesterase acid-like 3